MMLRFLAPLLGSSVLLASADASSYRWAGTPVSFDSDSIWTGASPNDAASFPEYTVFGTSRKTTIANAPSNNGQAYNLGYKINLLGNAKIILGDGRPGSRTRLLLNRAETTGDDIATFAPRSLNDNTNIAASGFDYNCNLNWRLNGQQIPANPPCVSADVTIPTGAWYLSTFGNPAAAASINTEYSAARTACDRMSMIPNELLFDSDPVVMDVQNCQRSFQFPASDADFGECPESSCASVTLSVDEDGNTVQVVTAGPNAWTAYVVDADSLTVSANTMTASTSADGVALYTFSNITVSETGEIIPAAAVDSSSSGSNAGDDGDSGTLIIVVVIIAFVLIIGIVVVVFVMVKKQNESADVLRGSAVSFENPLYDQADEGAASQDQGMYDNPVMAGNENSGYMDVPATGEEEAEGFGGAESSGYMDISPQADGVDDPEDI